MSRRLPMSQYVAHLLLAVGWMLVQDGVAPVGVSAIPMENQAEKQANFKQQALGGLFHRWTFDQQKPGDTLSGFSQFIVGSNVSPVSVTTPTARPPGPKRRYPLVCQYGRGPPPPDRPDGRRFPG